MSIKSDNHWLRAIADAGYGLTNSKAVSARDGLCWHAILTHGRIKVVTASNGGYGGPDELDMCTDQKASPAALVELLEQFKRLPQFLDYARDMELEGLNLRRQFERITDVEFEEESAKIRSTVPRVNDDTVAAVIGRMADISTFEKKAKRDCMTKICVVTNVADQAHTYFAHKAEDNPVNRATVKAFYKDRFGYFLADLLDRKL